MIRRDCVVFDYICFYFAPFPFSFLYQFIWLREFREFKDKSCAINQDTGVSGDLTEMVKRWYVPGRKIAVGKAEYKVIIEKSLVSVKLPCLVMFVNNIGHQFC